jgi:HEAT repeat protein
MRYTKLVLIGLAVIAAASSRAVAGRGSSPAAIQSAIASNSVDVIESELERAEHLVCPVCVKMVRPLIDHPDRRVRLVAAWWLVRRGLGADLLASMTDRLAGSDPVEARNAADVLAQLRRADSLGALGAAVADPRLAVQVRVAVATALGATGEQSALVPLGRALGAAEPPVRVAALAGMRGVRGFQDPGAAVSLLLDADESVRAEAILTVGATRTKAMASSAGQGAVANLVKLVEGDSSARIRKNAAWALGEIGAPAALAGPALSRAAREDRDPLVRSLASAAQARLTR